MAQAQKDNLVNFSTGDKNAPDFIPFDEDGVQPYIAELPGWLGGIQFKIVQQQTPNAYGSKSHTSHLNPTLQRQIEDQRLIMHQ